MNSLNLILSDIPLISTSAEEPGLDVENVSPFSQPLEAPQKKKTFPEWRKNSELNRTVVQLSDIEIKTEELFLQQRKEAAVAAYQASPHPILKHIAEKHQISVEDLRNEIMERGISTPGQGKYKQTYDPKAMDRAIEKIKKSNISIRQAAKEEGLTYGAVASQKRIRLTGKYKLSFKKRKS